MEGPIFQETKPRIGIFKTNDKRELSFPLGTDIPSLPRLIRRAWSGYKRKDTEQLGSKKNQEEKNEMLSKCHIAPFIHI